MVTLSEEMSQWEIHELRTLLNVYVMEVTLYVRVHPEASTLLDILADLILKLKAGQLEVLKEKRDAM